MWLLDLSVRGRYSVWVSIRNKGNEDFVRGMAFTGEIISVIRGGAVGSVTPGENTFYGMGSLWVMGLIAVGGVDRVGCAAGGFI